MRLRAEMTIEIEACDFVEAADHQQKLNAALRGIKAEYPQTKFALRTVREAGVAETRQDKGKMRRHTGNLALYTVD